jgi:hypothetical protein
MYFSLHVIRREDGKTKDAELNGSQQALKLIPAFISLYYFWVGYFMTPSVARLYMR